MMRLHSLIFLMATVGFATSAAADNIAECEVVLMESVEDGAGAVASFRDAATFIASVYDPETEILSEVDGFAIRGLMCRRDSPIPTKGDLPLIGSGVPFILSTDFDSSEAATVNIALDENRMPVTLMAAGLSDEQAEALDDVLALYEPMLIEDMPMEDMPSPETLAESVDAPGPK